MDPLGRTILLLALLIVSAACTDQPGQEAQADPVPSQSQSDGVPTFPSPLPAPSPTSKPEPRTNAVVVRVVDGDTIEARFRGSFIDVRLIGVDTPETVHPSEPVECYGPAASRFTERRLERRRVRLTFDVERQDRFGRTLAYVWLGDELFNERLVRNGYATVSTFPPNVRYVERFLAAQRFARNHGRGLWGDVCAPEPPPAPVAGGGNCDGSYPGVCIPPYPPDLDCADVPYSQFRVTGSDPHGFDGDEDGVGCES